MRGRFLKKAPQKLSHIKGLGIIRSRFISLNGYKFSFVPLCVVGRGFTPAVKAVQNQRYGGTKAPPYGIRDVFLSRRGRRPRRPAVIKVRCVPRRRVAGDVDPYDLEQCLICSHNTPTNQNLRCREADFKQLEINVRN